MTLDELIHKLIGLRDNTEIPGGTEVVIAIGLHEEDCTSVEYADGAVVLN